MDSNTLVVDAANNRVGINTASPDYALDLGTSGTGNQIRARRIYANGTGTDSGYTLDNTLIFQGASNSFNITNPGSYPSVAFTINSSGNVGIGTTSPIAPLTVLSASTGYSSDSQIKISDGSTSYYGGLSFDDAGSTRLSVRNSYDGAGSIIGFGFGSSADKVQIIDGTGLIVNEGNVGIGTTSPNYPIDLQRTTSPLTLNLKLNKSSTTNDYAEIAFQLWSGAGSGENTFGGVGTSRPSVVLRAINENGGSAAGAFVIGTFTGGADNSTLTEKFRITSAGNVGIGTTAPTAKLHVWNGGIKTSAFPSAGNPFTFLESNYADSAVTIRFQNINPSNELDADLGIQLMNTGGSITDVLIIKGSTGNVGIGTTSPNEKLTILGSAATTFQGAGIYNSYTYGNADKAESRFNLGKLESSTYQPMGAIGASPTANTDSADGYLSFYTRVSQSVTEKMRITSGGNVGIGTTSPSYKLDVNGATQIQNELILSTNDAAFRLYRTTGVNYFDWSSGQDLRFSTVTSIGGAGRSTAVTFLSTGEVGIGTTSPASKLQINVGTNQNVAINSTGGVARISAYDDAVANSVPLIINGSDLRLHNNSAEAVRITGGNVGIGTTSPAEKLHAIGNIKIEQTSNVSAILTLNPNSGALGTGYQWNLVGVNSVASYAFQIREASTAYLHINNSAGGGGGNVGIGTTAPYTTLTIGTTDATAEISSGGPNTHLTLKTVGAAGAIRFFTVGGTTSNLATTESMRIAAGGNVLINTTTDSGYKLDVSGSAYISNTATIVGGGNTLLLLKGTGSAAIAFGGTSDQASALIEGISGGGLNVYTSNGGTFTTPNWASRFQIAAAGAATFTSSVTASSLIKSGGTSAQYLMADGSVSTLTNPVTGTGTTNYVPKFTSASAIGNSNLINDASGNLGLGVTPSAWNSAYKAFQFGTTGALFGESGDAANYLTTNTFIDSVGFKYITSDWALGYFQENGVHSWKIAPSGTAGDAITFTQAMTLTAGGNVGIGTTSPFNKLTVGSVPASGYGLITISADWASGSAISTGVKIGAAADTGSAGVDIRSHSNYAASSGTEMSFWTNSTGNVLSERMRITSAGNVGIGTTSPISKLDVNGSIQAGSGNTFGTGVNGASIYMSANSGVGLSGNLGGYSRNLIKTDGTSVIEIGDTATSIISAINISAGDATGVIALKTGGNNTRLHITSGGNVGIGTTAPGALLQVGVSNNTSDALLRLGVIYDTTGRSSRGGITWHDASNTTGKIYTEYDGTMVSMVFGSLYNSGYNSNQLMIIRGNGNVGIGTTSPQSRLDLSPSLAQSTSATLGYSANAAINIRIPNSVGDVGQIVFTNDAAPTAGYASIGTIMTSGAGVGVGDLIFSTKSVGSDAASTERLRITSAGNVGIGTTSPGVKLEVNGASGEVLRLSMPVTYVANAGPKLSFWNAASEELGFVRGVFNETSQGNRANLLFGTRTSDALGPETKMTILHDGNVGIGTTSPAVKLEVIGSIRNKNSSGNANYSQFSTTEATLTISTHSVNTAAYPAPIIFSPNLSEQMRITDAGNVGIGTTAPGYKLEVNGGPINIINGYSEPTSEAGYRLKFADNGGVNNDSGIGLSGSLGDESLWINKGSANGNIRFMFGTLGEKVTFTSAGNVGIGTTAPNAQLNITKTFNASAGAQTNPTGGASVAIDYQTTSDIQGRIRSRDWDGATWKNLTFEANNIILYPAGNVGIGTTAPDEKLHVDGSTLITYNNSFQSTNSVGNKAILARVSPTSGIVNYAEYATATNLNGFVIGSDDARVKGNITGDSLEFITNTSTRMTVLSSGNVGINTTTPGSTLHVVGDVLIQTGALGVGVNPNATDGRIDASNDIVAFSTSDKRLKENITPIANALEKVRSLTGVEFDWKEETKSVHGYEGHDVGVIAQDVQAVLPEAVRTNDTGYLSVRYEKMIALLIEANKELANRVEQLEKLIK